MKLVKSLVAAAAVMLSTAAMAGSTISVVGGETPTSFSGLSGTFNPVTYAGFNLTDYGTTFKKNATVSFSAATDIVLTFVGKEAGDKSAFGVGIRSAGTDALFNTGSVGSKVASHAAIGSFEFYFYDLKTGLLVSSPDVAIGVAQGADLSKALFVFNDNGSGDGDYDDMVVSITAVPEVETYAMMLAGLGLMGSIARRRNKAKAA